MGKFNLDVRKRKKTTDFENGFFFHSIARSGTKLQGEREFEAAKTAKRDFLQA